MPETVLIIDDEQAIASLTALWMQHAGFHTVVTNDGKSGLALAATQRPHVILLDIRMPDLDGFEVHRQLKAAPELADIPVIFLSAHAQEGTRQEAAALGAGFLSKPYDRDTLTMTVRAAARSAAHVPLILASGLTSDCTAF